MKQELVFEAPRRALPPTHLADLDEAGRVEAVAALGLPPNFAVRPSRLPTINPRIRIPWEQLLAQIGRAHV